MPALHSAKKRILIILLSTLVLSSANKQEIYAKFTKGKAVATSHTSLQQCSQIQCVRKCFEEGKTGACSVAGYNKARKVCYLSTDSEDEVVDVADELSGVFILPQPTQDLIAIGPTCATEEALIDGNTPIPDGQMTASSNNFGISASSARINFSGAWCASFSEIGSSPPQMWIQVRFMGTSTVNEVQTQGNPPHTDWVTSYRLEYSLDCVAFNPILDTDGNGKVFPGSIDDTTIITNLLPTPVNALCMRLYPLTWNDYPSLRHEYLGCPLV